MAGDDRPLGCGIQTGAGPVINALQVAPGASFAAFGAGAVGLAAVMAARLAGAAIIIAADVFIPRLIDLYMQGRFPFDRLVKFYSLDQINEAAGHSEKGSTIKPVIRVM